MSVKRELYHRAYRFLRLPQKAGRIRRRLHVGAALAELLNNQKILDNLRDGIPYPYTQKDAETFIAEMLSADPDKTFSYAVTAGGHLAGSVSIFRCGNIHFRTAEIGYYIGENFWGHGIATHAVKQACGDIFARTDILRIFAEPFSYNAYLKKQDSSLKGSLETTP